MIFGYERAEIAAAVKGDAALGFDSGDDMPRTTLTTVRQAPAHPTCPAERHNITLPARLTWKDASGAIRFVSVVTRNVSETGVFVECEAGAAIPLYRMVYLQLERSGAMAEEIPTRLRAGRVLSAVWRVGPRRASTGAPSGYALRFLIDPFEAAQPVTENRSRMAVAS